MKITLYKNVSENNKLNKTLYHMIQLTGTLRVPTSILNPVIDIEFNTLDVTIEGTPLYNNNDLVYNTNNEITYSSDGSLLDSNFAYIDEYKRFYFINDKIIMSNKMIRLNMNVDVLMSFKETILNQRGFISRNEFEYDKLINDNLINFKWNKEITIIDTDNLIQVGAISKFKENPTYNVVMTYLTNHTDGCYVSNGSIIKTPTSDTTAFNNSTNYLVTTPDNMKHFSKELFNDDTLLSFIKGCRIYPFDVEKIDRDTYTKFTIGTTDITIANSFLIGVRYKNVRYVNESLIIAHFKYEINQNDLSFIDLEPFTKYELFLPFHKWIEIDSNLLINKVIRVQYIINHEDGNTYVSVLSNGILIYQSEVTLGTEIALSSSNTREHNDKLLSIGLNTGVNAIGSVLGMATGNPIGIASGVLNLTKTTGSLVSELNTNYIKANTIAQGGSIGLYNYYNVRIRKTRNVDTTYNDEYFKLIGRPLNKIKTLNELSGFTKVGEINLENFNCSGAELTMIENELKKGIII